MGAKAIESGFKGKTLHRRCVLSEEGAGMRTRITITITMVHMWQCLTAMAMHACTHARGGWMRTARSALLCRKAQLAGRHRACKQ